MGDPAAAANAEPTPEDGPLAGESRATFGGGRMKLPKASGTLPVGNAMVFVTVLFAVATAETVSD